VVLYLGILKGYQEGFLVLTAVVKNVAIFWEMSPCSPYVNRCSSKTPVHIWAARHCIPKDGNIQDLRQVSRIVLLLRNSAAVHKSWETVAAVSNHCVWPPVIMSCSEEKDAV
jgi:hypothetical protein